MEFKLPEGVDSMQLLGDSGSKEFVIPGGDENDITIQANSANRPIPKGRTSPFQGKDGLVRFSAYASEQRDERDRNATLESKPLENKNQEDDDDDKLQFDMDGFTGGRRKSKRKRKKKKRKTKKKKRKPRRKSRKRRRKRKTKRKFRNQRGCKR